MQHREQKWVSVPANPAEHKLVPPPAKSNSINTEATSTHHLAHIDTGTVPLNKFKYTSTRDQTIRHPNRSSKRKRRLSYCQLNGKIYQKQKMIGEGTYGKVYLFVAKYNPEDRIVIKEEKPFAKGEFAHTIARECVFNQILFGNQTGYAGNLQDEKSPIYVASPYLEYPLLFCIIFKSPIALLRVCIAIIDKLQELHSHKLVHGDIKGDNIFVKINENGKIDIFFIDTTFSNFINDPTGGFNANYMAPELQDDVDASINQDIYSLGYLFETLFSHYAKLFSSSRADLQAICEDMLQKEPGKRISLQESNERLHKILQQQLKLHAHCTANLKKAQQTIASFDSFTLDQWCYFEYLLNLLKRNELSELRLEKIFKLSKKLLTLVTKKGPEALAKITFPIDLLKMTLADFSMLHGLISKIKSKYRMRLIANLGNHFFNKNVAQLEEMSSIIKLLPKESVLPFFRFMDMDQLKKIINEYDHLHFLLFKYPQVEIQEVITKKLGALHCQKIMGHSLENFLNILSLLGSEVRNDFVKKFQADYLVQFIFEEEELSGLFALIGAQDRLTVWQQLHPEHQETIIDGSPVKLMRLLKFFNLDEQAIILKKISEKNLTLLLINLDQFNQYSENVYLQKMIIEVSLAKIGVSGTLACLDSYAGDQPLFYKKMVCMVNDLYRERREKSADYHHWYGSFFGHHKNKKVDASSLLSKIVKEDLSNETAKKLAQEHRAALASGDLYEIAIRLMP